MTEPRPDDCLCGQTVAAHDATDYPDPRCGCWWYEPVETEQGQS